MALVVQYLGLRMHLSVKLADALHAGVLQRVLLESSTLACVVTDERGTVVMFNVGAQRAWGYAEADAVGRITMAQLFDPRDVAAQIGRLALRTGDELSDSVAALTYDAVRSDTAITMMTCVSAGGHFWQARVSIAAIRDEGGVLGYLLLAGNDLTRKAVEPQQLARNALHREQEIFTRSMIESDVDALAAVDVTGVITDVNRHMEMLMACTHEVLIGTPFASWFTEPDRAEAAIAQTLREHKLSNVELTARAQDGRLKVISYNATTFYDRNAVLQGVFIAARDLTEIKRYEGELQQKNTELEYASRMKSEFLANMSHELRTPLNAIIGFSEVLRDGLVGPLSESQRTFLADIFSSGNHLLSLINDILDLSKVEAGKMTLELEDIDLASLCGNSLSIIREKAASRNVQLTMDAMSECAVLRADARKVKQIVYNLLANAVKFTERGHVALRVETVPRARVGELLGAWPGRALPLAFNEFNEFIKISVTDSGIGISPTGMAGLFKPFSQIDSGLSREFAGTGLGLALVKLMVELHGGTVAVQSQVNEGACFSVWLPLRAPQLQADGTALAGMAPTRAVEPPTALVIEADAQARELIRLQLEAEGFAVVHAASGPAAVSLAQAQKVALITLDINLPTMDGWELLTELKQIPNLAQIPVVVISLDAEHSRGVALGAAAVLQKPLSRVALQDALVAIGMFPRALALRVLVVDDDPASMELIAHRITALGGTVLRATGGLVAIEMATREAPDLIVLDLMMPDINGFEVVEALRQRNRTVRIPILVITAKDVAKEDRARLRGAVITIMEKSNFGVAMFVTEVRRAIAGRHLVP